ncbi:unnamed protein product [Symbiodinium natans]|uniref:Uncharacterized protein n=1 Tax=Symbiodinium natans TaxID=878477 RepID=A0A812LK00_9DINO|nr:unnamed protein product [Symbiodinium natans]
MSVHHCRSTVLAPVQTHEENARLWERLPPLSFGKLEASAHVCCVVSLSIVSRGKHRTVLQADLSAASLQNSVCPTGRTVLADVNVATGCARCPRSVPSEHGSPTGIAAKPQAPLSKKSTQNPEHPGDCRVDLH